MAKKAASPKSCLKKHCACASTVEIAYKLENVGVDPKWTEEELDEIIDAAVHLMEYALQRKPNPEFAYDKTKKRLDISKLVTVYTDMRRCQDEEATEVEFQIEDENKENLKKEESIEDVDLKQI